MVQKCKTVQHKIWGGGSYVQDRYTFFITLVLASTKKIMQNHELLDSFANVWGDCNYRVSFAEMMAFSSFFLDTWMYEIERSFIHSILFNSRVNFYRCPFFVFVKVSICLNEYLLHALCDIFWGVNLVVGTYSLINFMLPIEENWYPHFMLLQFYRRRKDNNYGPDETYRVFLHFAPFFAKHGENKRNVLKREKAISL